VAAPVDAGDRIFARCEVHRPACLSLMVCAPGARNA
jgi:hypothetical protein